ncbi:P-loop containing nucleoside triphosphate hydrolase protein [Pseudomassariella vexata]|uniref:p-loop containing nucleoside triphosphate hydrolase protein n=1 Tax=Pseudomassariella vexata TaxID=1141098 RepID=A0A1Y2D601_9PEZI|nr:P-loop containing nucleoside triphosphate hydrolase protein [Pseudomassariella vexata]ORY54584.1 P-loop containing nucleoside triphosphate hydrolase protein [Pseudomassariella vexata]
MDFDDSRSSTSFEDIGAKLLTHGADYDESKWGGVDNDVNKLKALIAKSTSKNARELADGEVQDVCYVLQYKGLSGKITEVHRSSEPIKIQLDDTKDDSLGTRKNKPVLEIVTKVSTSIVNKSGNGYGRQPPPSPSNLYDQYFHNDNYGEYAYGNARSRKKEEDGSNMKIANIERTAMMIHSPYLINALKAVVGYYPAASFIGDSVRIDAPYQVLVHHRAALARYKYAFATAKHIDVLLGFIEKTLGKELRAEEERHNSSTPKATFDKLWMIYKPGEVVYVNYNNKWTPFVISRCLDEMPNPRDEAVVSPYTIDCWNVVYKGSKLRRMMHSFVVNAFSGEEAILGLTVIPARFFRGDDKDEDPLYIQRKHIELGKMVWDLAKGPVHMSYDGSLVETEPSSEWNPPTGARGYMSGRVIVDCEGFARYSGNCPGSSPGRPNEVPPPFTNRFTPPKCQLPYFAPCCGCSVCSSAAGKHERPSPFADFEDLDPTLDDAPSSDLYYLVLTKVVSGFILGKRRWGHFNVEDLEEVKFDKEAFKYLVLDDEIKLTVKALIGKFSSNNGQVTPWPNDFVKNKGQGRIFLLHGSPGVGKTCTVECVAELARRPLLSLTSGDLSTMSCTVEKSLEYFLQLGERFGAIVLLDEADVYLETRRTKDIARNGLVSIFLRALEYYRGVLFLTTNRVQTFDSAFTSRIHVALHYKSLTHTDREKIWLNSFERLERDSNGRVHISVATREYAYESQDVHSLRWNGREIRNALQTAVALAETEADEEGQEKVIVTDKHLRSVVKMSRGLRIYCFDAGTVMTILLGAIGMLFMRRTTTTTARMSFMTDDGWLM